MKTENTTERFKHPADLAPREQTPAEIRHRNLNFSKPGRVRGSNIFDLLISSASPKRRAMQSALSSGRRDYPEHRQIIAGMSQLGRAMAFAARIWDANRGRFLVSLDDAKWYSEHIDAAIEIEQKSICRGNMPRRRLTIGYVEELLASSTGPSAERGPEAVNGASSTGSII